MSGTNTDPAERFLALLKPIQRDLETYSRRLVWNPQEAPDTLQNAVLRAFAAFDRCYADTSFRAWMFKILTHEAFAMNRKHARIARREFQLDPEELADLAPCGTGGLEDDRSLSGEALNEALEPALLAGLKTLTEAERAALLLRSIGGLRYREIGESLGIPMGTVMTSLFRARQKMRAFLGRPARCDEQLEENDL